MLVTIERPTALQIAVRAWSSLFQALPRLALLFSATAILVSVLNWLPTFFALATVDDLDPIVKSGGSLQGRVVLAAIGLDFVQTLTRAFIVAPAVVAMYRFILLNDADHFSFLVAGRYAIWSFAITGLAMFFAWMGAFVPQMILAFLLVCPLAIGLAILIIKSMLLYPAVAVSEKSASAFSRIETAFKRSGGMFWLTVGALALTLLPVGLIEGAALYEFGRSASLYAELGGGVVTVFYVVLTAAVASYLYSYAAHRNFPNYASPQNSRS